MDLPLLIMVDREKLLDVKRCQPNKNDLRCAPAVNVTCRQFAIVRATNTAKTSSVLNGSQYNRGAIKLDLLFLKYNIVN